MWRDLASTVRRLRVWPVGTVHRVISEQAAHIRASMEAETIDPGWTVQAERQGWEQAASDDQLAPRTTEAVEMIAGVPGLWIEPDGADAGSPVMVYAHGGGLIAGSPTTHRAFASRLAVACQARLLLVDYRLLPDHPFPAPLDDVVAVVDDLASSGRTAAHRIVLAGDSSGAGLAISAACVMRDRGAPAIAGIVSLSGAFDATLTGESIDAARDPQLARPALERWQRTISPAVDLRDPQMSPIFAPLHDLPPSLLLVGGDEVWLSDSMRLADQMTEAGSSVSLKVFDGMWHVWPMHGEFPESTTALTEIARFVATVVSGEPEPQHRAS